MKNILVTGNVGFIGYHVSKKLLDFGHHVTGVDNFNAYYDHRLKKARFELLQKYENFQQRVLDIRKPKEMEVAFSGRRFDVVIHLAAQAGVKYSLENPQAFIDANVTGFLNILEGCVRQKLPYLIYASSSSVYGDQFTKAKETDSRKPLSLYAATKAANEEMAFAYLRSYGLPSTALRFFTVYGPWGRPDMSLFKFTKAALEGTALGITSNGTPARDFTYVEDVAEVVHRLVALPAPPKFREILNVCGGRSIEIQEALKIIEQVTGKLILKKYEPSSAAEVLISQGSTELLDQTLGYVPPTTIEEGLPRFIEWYKGYYGTP